MATQEENRIQLEKYAAEFYAQALNLTLANPLLRLPSRTRSTGFLELPGDQMQLVANTLARDEREIVLIGENASRAEVDLAVASIRPGSRGPLRIAVAQEHTQVEARMRTLAKKHDELVEKRGLPCAYIALGCLKWKPDDGKETLSPLLLVPVEIDAVQDPRLLKTIQTITLAEREAIENPALREYLKLKFGLNLPRFDHTIDTSAANVVRWLREEVRRLTATKPEWQIIESATFGLFDCGAIAADCDAKNWTLPLHERELLKKLFLSTHTEPQRYDPPAFISSSLVLEADGSQLEAMQQVARGSSIVLHGPPGSGKSQTIVNLIAQAFAAGKRVLFVAQKPEAAHVVHRRLIERGLAPFCTLLVPVGDSRNTKAAMLEGLRSRENLARPGKVILQPEVHQVERHVQLLQDHAAALRVVLPSLNRSARDIMAELATLELRGIAAVEKEDIALPSSIAGFIEAEDALTRLAQARAEVDDEAFARLGGLQPANGATPADRATFALQRDVASVRGGCAAISAAIDRLVGVGFGAHLSPRVAALGELAESMPPHRELSDEAVLHRAIRLRSPGAPEALERIERARATLADSQRRIPNSRVTMRDPAVRDMRTLREIESTLSRFSLSNLTLGNAAQIGHAADALRVAIETSSSDHSSGVIGALLSRSIDFEQWLRAVNALEALSAQEPGRTFLVKHCGTMRPEPNAVHDVWLRSVDLASARDRARSICIEELLPDLTTLRVAQSAIAARRSLTSRAISRIIDPQYRSARAIAKRSLLPGVPRLDWAVALERCIQLKEAERDWQTALGRLPKNAATGADPAHWEQADKWFARASEIAREARLPANSFWSAVVAFETQSPTSSEWDLLRAAGRLSRVETLAKGVANTLGTREVTPHLIAAALGTLSAATRAVSDIRSLLELAESASVEHAVNCAIKLAALRSQIDALESDVNAQDLLQDDFQGVDSDPSTYVETLSWVRTWQEPRYSRWSRLFDWVLQE